MNYRNLGKSNIKVSEIGLGTEYLNKQPQDVVFDIIHKAIRYGINYFDLVYTFSDYLENLATAFKGHRNNIYITGHLGSTEEDGKYRKTRNINECEEVFLKTLSSLDIDNVDVLLLQFVTANEYNKIVSPNNMLDLAIRFKREGKTRLIGLSTHNVSVGLKVAENEDIDILMFPINLAMHARPMVNDLFKACVKNNKGLVAMKPFAGGRLLQKKQSFVIPAYQTGGKILKKKKDISISPIQCISYILSHISISTIVPGVKSIEELDETLEYLNAEKDLKDFSSILTYFNDYITGKCVYCDHCLPCPSGISIGEVIRFLDLSKENEFKFDNIKSKDLINQASRCIECEACMVRCPFDVNVISKMKKAINFIEKK